MPVLSNPKHERFAQGLAQGVTATQAYIDAGYAANDGNAIRLKGKDTIARRVAEIQGRAAARAEISVASVTEVLLRLAKKGEALKDAPGLSVARASIMDAAKVNGLIVERKELSGPDGGAIEVVSNRDRAKAVAALVAKARG